MKPLYDGTSAYNLDEYESYARTTDKKRKERVQSRKKERTFVCRFLIVSLVAVFCVASALIYTNVMMIRAATKTQKLEDELALLTETNKKTEMEINGKLDMKVIEERAVSELGMQRPDNSQIVYVNVKRDTYTEVSDKKPGVHIAASFKEVIKGIMEYFG